MLINRKDRAMILFLAVILLPALLCFGCREKDEHETLIHLKSLYIGENPVNDDDIEYLKQALPDMDLNNRDLRDSILR